MLFLSVDFCSLIWRHDSPTYGLFHVFALYHFRGFVSLYFVVGRILVFRYTFLMLCENKIRPQFFGINTYCAFHFRAAIYESFGFV